MTSRDIKVHNETFNLLCQILGVVVGNAAIVFPLWLWSRAENRADMRQVQDIQAADRRDLLTITRTIQEDIRAFQSAMAQESKDFHTRLCMIEERTRGK